MKNKRLFYVMIIFIFLFSSSMRLPCYANAAEPPSIIIIVPNAPDDLKISVASNGKNYEGREYDKVIEKYYTFYARDIQQINKYNLIVSTEKESFELEMDKPIKYYNNIYSLNLKDHTLTEGKLFTRSFFLVSMRVLLTLVIEGIIFLIFGFRNKKSWIAFLAINLITQGVLNIWINGFTPRESYLIFSLVYGEFFVFIAEIILFQSFCKEHSRLRKVFYVLTANLISLIVGGYIITILPI